MAEKFVVPEADAAGRFGEFGGRFVPETLMAPVEELTLAYAKARADASFRRELHGLLTTYAGRPTPLTEARRLVERGQQNGGGHSIADYRVDRAR